MGVAVAVEAISGDLVSPGNDRGTEITRCRVPGNTPTVSDYLISANESKLL